MSDSEETPGQKTTTTNVWSRGKTLRLIQLFRALPELWLAKYSDRKIRSKRSAAIEKIVVEIGVERKEVIRKLHNLRCQFNAETRKLKNARSGRGTGDSYRSKWEFFEALKFMGNQNEGGTVGSTGSWYEATESRTSEHSCAAVPPMPSNGEVTSLDLMTSGITVKAEPIEEDPDDSDFVNVVADESVYEADARQPSSPFAPAMETRPKPERTKTRRNHTAVHRGKCDQEHGLSVLEKPADEHQIFANFVAQELRSIKSDVLRKKLKRMIQRDILLVTEEEASLSPTSPCSSTSPTLMYSSSENLYEMQVLPDMYQSTGTNSPGNSR